MGSTARDHRDSDQRGETAAGADRDAVWSAYAAFLRRPPETVLEWHDPESPASGWLVVDSLRGGAAGGGTRMRPGLDRDEVTFLAKAMGLKFSVSGPPIGGAKSGLDFDPSDPRKPEVLLRWFRAARPILESRCGTGGDLNVDETLEVLPLAVEAGLAHPQQGVLRGHLGLEGVALERRLVAMRSALGRIPDGDLGLPAAGLRVSDLVTGYGVAVAARRRAERGGGNLDGARVLLEGFGSVGGAAALYLTRWGARIVGVVDAHAALVSERGLGREEVGALLLQRRGNRLPLALPPEEAERARERFARVGAELCVCAAASGTVDREILLRLEARGVETIVCGANRPFATSRPGDAGLEREADRRLAVVPDFIANCGAAHAFAYQVARDEPADPREIFDAVETTVCRALDEAVALAGGAERGLVGAALGAALERVGG